MFIANVSIDNYRYFTNPIDVNFHKEKIIAIVGKNSTGKTTFLKYICDYFNSYYISYYDFNYIYPISNSNIVYISLAENIFQFYNSYNKTWLSISMSRNLDEEYLRNIPHDLPYDNLSSGEKSYLNLISSLTQFSTHNTLFLIDEVDAFINPVLKNEYISIFEKILKDTTSQIIFTTHSCDLLSDLTEKQVYLCSNKNIENIDFNPFGLNKEIIKKKLFDIDSGLSKKAQNKIKEINTAIKNLDYSYPLIETIQNIENEISSLADSPSKDELLKKVNDFKRKRGI